MSVKRAKRATARFDTRFSVTMLLGVQVNTVLHTVDFPGTLYGLRWEFDTQEVVADQGCDVYWMLIIVPYTETPNSLSIGVGAPFYKPVTGMMHIGKHFVHKVVVPDTADNKLIYHERNSTNIQIKVHTGDRLYLITKGNSSVISDVAMQGLMSFYVKI